METPSLGAIKAELQNLNHPELVAICLRLGRFKLENKELLGYLLFEAHRPDDFVQQVNAFVSGELAGMNTNTAYFAKKSIRRVLRLIGKYARFMGSKQAEAEMLIHFIREMGQVPGSIRRNAVIEKIMNRQAQKVRSLLKSLHEDLQYDLRRQLDEIA